MAGFGKMSLFTEVVGVVLDHGKPVADAEVERVYNWGWKDKTVSVKTTTDADGRFRFDEVVESSFSGSLLPHEPVIVQKIFIRTGGQEYKAWTYTKHNYEPGGERMGQPIEIECPLEVKPDFHGDVFGICTPMNPTS